MYVRVCNFSNFYKINEQCTNGYIVQFGEFRLLPVIFKPYLLNQQ